MMDLELVNARLHVYFKGNPMINDNVVFVFTTNGVADYMMTTNQPIGETASMYRCNDITDGP